MFSILNLRLGAEISKQGGFKGPVSLQGAGGAEQSGNQAEDGQFTYLEDHGT